MARRSCTKYCASDLNKEIDIIKRTIEVDAISYDVDLTTDLANIPAGIKTLSGVSKFDGTNTEVRSSHRFVIRFIDGIEEDNSVFYDNRIFVINQTINLDEDNKWLEIYTTERGVAVAVNGVTKKVNFT